MSYPGCASSAIRISELKSISLLNYLSVIYPEVWRSDSCSPQPVSSCSLQETHIKHHQMCEHGVFQTDCIFLSYLPHKLETHKYTNMQMTIEITWRQTFTNWVSVTSNSKKSKTIWTSSDMRLTYQMQDKPNFFWIPPHTQLKHTHKYKHHYDHHTQRHHHNLFLWFSKLQLFLPPWLQT